MALTFSTTPTDVSAHRRKLPRELGGDFLIHEHFHDHHFKIFLKRNMTRALKAQEKRHARQQQNRLTSTRTTVRGASSNGVNLNGQYGPSRMDAPLPNGIDPITKCSDGTNGNKERSIETHDTPTPALEAMSRETLHVRRRRDNYQGDKRFSSRRQSLQKQNDPKSQLVIKLCNIRKKLNWKTNRPSVDDRPRKRARVEGLDCVVHLTVWARNPGKKENAWEQKVTRSQVCQMLRGSEDYDPVKGRFIEIKSKSCFSFRRDELTVMTQQGPARKLVMAEDYFMEIKIVPEVTDYDWPPIPLLGRVANEDSTLDSLAKETLQDSIVAVYKKLPDAPDADAPLSVCFVDDAGTLESKYGLELEARWAAPDEQIPDCDLEPLDEWMLDEESKPFGRTDPTRILEKQTAILDNVDKPVERTESSKKPKKLAAKKSTDPTRAGKPKKLPLLPLQQPKVIYEFDLKSMGGRRDNKKFQKTSVNGYQCPFECHKPTRPSLEDLLLHFEQTHEGYIFTLESAVPPDSTNGDTMIRVKEAEIAKPRKREKKQPKDEEKCWGWSAPSEPFVLHRHVIEDDKSWFAKREQPDSRKDTSFKPRFPKNANLDPQTALRIEHGGFLPHHYVQPFRPAAHQRKKYSNVRLRTQEHVGDTPYTSVSHRLIDPEDPGEDARSETDDEADDSWFIAHHLEELDLHAREEDWSDAKHRLAKKWDYHVLHRERSVSSRYMSDCLIRFIRIERVWILQTGQNPDREQADDSAARITALMQLMDELKEKRVINDAVCADVLTMLYSDHDLAIPEEEKAQIEEETRQAQQRKHDIQNGIELVNTVAQAKYHHDPKGKTTTTKPGAKSAPIPADICAKCHNPFQHQKRRAVRCSALDCIQPNTWYHAKCAGLTLPTAESTDDSFAKQRVQLESTFMKERLSWRCPSCAKVKT